MAVGDLINYTNYVALDGTAWRSSKNIGRIGTYTYILTAPAFYVKVNIKGGGWWGYQEGSFYVYPYDESTGTFSSKAVVGSYQTGRGSGYSYTWEWYHNYNGGSAEDIHDIHIWKVVVYIGNNDGSYSGNLYAGGLGCIKESLYADYFKNRPIYYSKGEYWTIASGSTYTTIDACLKAENYSVMRGTQIAVNTGTYKYITAKKL
jgi:hypothetical protein